MNLLQDIADNEARLAINSKAWIEWNCPPKDTEEELIRSQVDQKIARIAYELQESIGEIILSIIKLEVERGNNG